MKVSALLLALVPAVAVACPTCARDEPPTRAALVVAMMVVPLAVGALAALVLKRLGSK